MRTHIRRTGRTRLATTSLLLVAPLTLGTAACAADEGDDEGVVEEGVGEEEEDE